MTVSAGPDEMLHSGAYHLSLGSLWECKHKKISIE